MFFISKAHVYVILFILGRPRCPQKQTTARRMDQQVRGGDAVKIGEIQGRCRRDGDDKAHLRPQHYGSRWATGGQVVFIAAVTTLRSRLSLRQR